MAPATNRSSLTCPPQAGRFLGPIAQFGEHPKPLRYSEGQSPSFAPTLYKFKLKKKYGAMDLVDTKYLKGLEKKYSD